MSVVFQSPCSSSGDFNNVSASATTLGGNNGMFGTLGASASLRIVHTGGNFVYEGVEKTLASTCTVFRFFYRPASTVTSGTGNTIFTAWGDASHTATLAPFRLDYSTSGTGYKLAIVDGTNSFTTTLGTTVFVKGTVIEITCYQKSTGWEVYVNNGTSPEVTYTRTQTPGITYLSWGTHFQNATGSLSGTIDIDEIWCGNVNSAPSGAYNTAYEVYQGYLMNHLTAQGQPFRNPVDGKDNSGAAAIDTVSEGAAYMLLLAAQFNDQVSFNLCDNWILQNLLRSNSTTGNTQSNAAPSTGLSLMCWHYNSANTDGKGIGTIYDANGAYDADPDRAQALWWAHSRWGSSANTVGSAPELAAPNYLQRFRNVRDDIRQYVLRQSSATGYYYLMNDALQTSDPVQIAPDYINPAAFRLFLADDPTNAAIWTAAINGCHDIITKAANQVMSGATPTQSSSVKLTPNWISFTLSTGFTSGTPSSYGDSDYGFNSFRMPMRYYMDWYWSRDPSTLTVLQLTKSFWANEYSVNSKIRATFKHNGTNTGSYENCLFTYSAYWHLYADDYSNSTAAALQTNKLSSRFLQAPYGSIFDETVLSGGSTVYSYFSQSWLIIDYMLLNNLWRNYGAPFTQPLTAGLTFSGTLKKAARKSLTAGLSFIGAFSKRTSRALTAALSFVGTLITLWKKLQNLVDNFQGGSLDTTKWGQFTGGGATITYSGTGATINYPASSTSSTDGDITSNTTWSLVGSYGQMEVLSVPVSTTSADAEMRFRKDANNYVRFVYEAGTLFAQYMVAASRTTAGSVAYSGTTHRWWRIRESGGTTFWDTSPDRSSWTNLGSVSTATLSFGLSGLSVLIAGTCFQVETSPGTFKFDNFNVVGNAFTQSFTAGLSFVGSFAKQTNRPLTAGLSFIGAFVKSARKSLKGTLGFSSGDRQNFVITPSFELNNLAAISGSGTAPTVTWSQTRALFGTSCLEMTQTVAGQDRWYQFSINGLTIGSTWTISAYFYISSYTAGATSNRLLYAATANFSQQPAYTNASPPTGAWTRVSVTLTNIDNQGVVIRLYAPQGTIDWDGIQMEQGSTASAYFDGANGGIWYGTADNSNSYIAGIGKRVTRSLTASLGFAGNLNRVNSKVFTAAVGFVGNFSKMVRKPFAASLGFVGTINRSTKKSLAASLGFVGALNRLTSRSFAAGLGFIGALTTSLTHAGGTAYTMTLTAGLSFSGSFSRTTVKTFTASLGFIGSMNKRIARSYAASLGFVGGLAKSSARAFTASLGFSGSLSRRTAHILTASLGLSGNLNKTISRSFTGGLSFVGNFVTSSVHVYTKVFTATLGFSGSLASNYFHSVVKPFLLSLGTSRNSKTLHDKSGGKELHDSDNKKTLG